MNESNTDIAQPEPAAPPDQSGGGSEREPVAHTTPAWRRPVMLALAAALAVVCWQWYDARSQIGAIREELALRLRASDSASGESLLLSLIHI